MCTEAVILYSATPVVVDHARALTARTDAVGPVVLVSETAAGPAEHGNFQFLERIEHVGTVTVGVGNLRVLAYPEASIDAGAEMFGKLAVNLLIDYGSVLLGLEVHGGFCTERRHGESRGRHQCDYLIIHWLLFDSKYYFSTSTAPPPVGSTNSYIPSVGMVFSATEPTIYRPSFLRGIRSV